MRSGTRVVIVGQKPYTIGGDIIVAINGERVTSSSQIAKILLHSRLGQQLQLRLYRKGQMFDVSIPLVAMDMQF